MPQVSLYLDQELLDGARQRAGIANISLSKYVAQALANNSSRSWPKAYWELFGALNDESFSYPEDIPFDEVAHEVAFS